MSLKSGFFVSLACHAVLFLPLPVGNLFFKPAAYDVEPDPGGMEINLVAAPTGAEPVKIRLEETPLDVVSSGDLLPATGLEPLPPIRGDGSSPVPGQDPTTAYLPFRPQVDGSSGSLKNRAPEYPARARSLGQEGRVLLSVHVDSTGQPTRVEIQESSGHPLLDEAALAAVRQWEFRPARSGFVPVESTVEVPIRFKLEKPSSMKFE